mmetsp:Transcript_9312/g.11779  ORF Transcript_9312/g.11779 Transcript_9312/m.11779 type:complete len:82 (-) Transcript_9312:417-662(-)
MDNISNMNHNYYCDGLYDDYDYSGYEDNYSCNANVKAGGGGGGGSNRNSVRTNKRGNKEIYNNKHIRNQAFMKAKSKARRC